MPNDWNKKFGPWAVVTGASDGIGKAISFELAGRGINLVLASRSGDKLETLATELRTTKNIQTLVIACDLSTAIGIETVIKQTADLEVGLLVASAGYGQFGDFINGHSEADMVAVNCIASVMLTRHFAPLMAKRKNGAIMLFGSIVAFQGAPFSANYAATKAYIQTLAEGLYHELKPHNVHVVCVAPGPVNTGFAARANMVMGKAEIAEHVAKTSINAIDKAFLVRPGFLAKILGYSLGILPRFARVVIMGKIMEASVNRSDGQNPKN